MSRPQQHLQVDARIIRSGVPPTPGVKHFPGTGSTWRNVLDNANLHALMTGRRCYIRRHYWGPLPGQSCWEWDVTR
jgi:hypothetical protein